MAAAIPFVTIEEAIASLSKIDVRKKTPIHLPKAFALFSVHTFGCGLKRL